jgi:hypothetical protein
VSVEAFQDKFTCVPLIAVAVSPVGTLGGIVSGVVILTPDDWEDVLPALSYSEMV